MQLDVYDGVKQSLFGLLSNTAAFSEAIKQNFARGVLAQEVKTMGISVCISKIEHHKFEMLVTGLSCTSDITRERVWKLCHHIPGCDTLELHQFV